MTARLERLGAALVAATLVAGCAVAEGPIEGAADVPRMIRGAIDGVDTAVVALLYDGEPFCSGTLIAGRTVLTAGHCLKDTRYSPKSIEIFFGTRLDGEGTVVACVAGGVHPSYRVSADGTPVHDVAYLTLGEDAPVAPMPWRSTSLPSLVGRSLKMVGYGVTSASRQTGDGVRRSITQVITDQDASFLYYGDGRSGTCQGDSGGPTLLDGEVVAVTSFGDDTCVEEGANTRVDAQADFISQHLTGEGAGGGSGGEDGVCGSGLTWGDEATDACIQGSCCPAVEACAANTTCSGCLTDPEGSGCAKSAKYKAVEACLADHGC